MSPDPLTPYGNRPMVTPIVNAVNYEYSSFEVLRQITDGEIDGYTYHRRQPDGPPWSRVAALEGRRLHHCTSGMAVVIVYLTYLPGDHVIIFHDTYGANYKFPYPRRLGVNITWLTRPGDDIDFPAAGHLHDLPGDPEQPLCKVIDIRAVRAAADKVGAMPVTTPHPYHQNPLKLGAHLVIHSATKGFGVTDRWQGHCGHEKTM